EAEMVAGHLGLGGGGPEATARALADAAGLVCVVTLGGRGALAAEPGNLWQQPAMAIEPVDTTGAGDAFTGVLAAGLDAALELPEALRRAGVGAGLACLALGAQESLPTAAAIDENLARLPPPRRLL
ncbi:MAG: ribokinase, partial [Inquilinus sp.]|nr:ribokinase [Inquilinus sp.]